MATSCPKSGAAPSSPPAGPDTSDGLLVERSAVPHGRWPGDSFVPTFAGPMAIDASTTPMRGSPRARVPLASARWTSPRSASYSTPSSPGSTRFVARRVEDRTVAEDLTAATFQRALGVVRGADFGNASFGGFLYRVAASAVVDHARRARRAIPSGVRASDLDEGGDAKAAETIGDRGRDTGLRGGDRPQSPPACARRHVRGGPRGSSCCGTSMGSRSTSCARSSAAPDRRLPYGCTRALRELRSRDRRGGDRCGLTTRVPDPRPGFDDLMRCRHRPALDADLEVLDQELAAAGQQARRMLYGRTQPTSGLLESSSAPGCSARRPCPLAEGTLPYAPTPR